MTYACKHVFPTKELVDMCLHKISFDLSLHLTLQTFSGFDDLISKAYDLEKRLFEHKRKRKGKTVVNKLESAMVGAKKPAATKLLVKKAPETATTFQLVQEVFAKQLPMKER